MSAIVPFTSVEPSITDLPITNDDDAGFYGWGHIDRTQFIDAVHAINVHWLNMDGDDRTFIADHEIEYVWAVHDPNNDEHWLWVEQGTPDAVPITFIDLSA